MNRFASRFAIKHAPATEAQQIVVPFQVKAESIDPGTRTFEGLASVWGLDLGDDVMHKGAFKGTIADWKKSNDAIPLLNSHNHFDVMSAVGQLLDAKETDAGLWTKWEVINGSDGDAMLERLRPSARTGRAAVSKMSIGYEPLKFDMEASDNARFGMVRNLRAVSLKEVSLVLFPMAPGARINVQSVKSFADCVGELKGLGVDGELKKELRRAASKIGAALAPTGKADDEEEEEAPSSTEEAPPETPPVQPAERGEAAADHVEETPLEEKAEEYLYGEALMHRIAKVILESRILDSKA